MTDIPKQIMAVSLFVKNDANQVLLVKTFNRGWDLPGGQVDRDTPRYYRTQDLLAFDGQIRYRAYTTRPYQVMQDNWM